MKKLYFILFISLFLGLTMSGTCFGAWSLIDTNDWWNDETYSFDDGDQLQFSVDVEIWNDDDIGQFLYGYQVTNLGEENLSTFEIHPGFPDKILDVGGDLVNNGLGLSSGGSFNWGNSLPSFLVAQEVDSINNYAYFGAANLNSGQSSIAWLTSSSGPGLGTLNAQGLGQGAGGIPAPIPEPTTLLLLGSGLFGLVGVGGRKYFKK